MNFPSIKLETGYIRDALIIGLLFLAVFELPEFATYNDHDFASQAAYEYWTKHGFAYGREIIQNVGPLGFINFPWIYTGFLDFPKLLINFVLTCSFVFLLWKHSKTLPVPIRAVFLILAGLCAAGDSMLYLLLLFISYQLMATTRAGSALVAVLLLALLALAKGPYLFIALFIIAGAGLSHILLRCYVVAISIIGGFVFFVMALWILVGQSAGGFLGFIYAIASFSNGYNGAQAIYESRAIQIIGFILLFGTLLIIILRMSNDIRKAHSSIPRVGQIVLSSAVESLILFVVWKHGFVRADSTHLVIFFQYVLVSCPWLVFRGESHTGAEAMTSNLLMRLSIHTGIIVSIVSFSVIFNGTKGLLWDKYYKMERVGTGIANIPTLFSRLDEELKSNIQTLRMPHTRALAGTSTIGYFGALPGMMLYNDLNYVATPSTISFASWNAGIMEADEKFFTDEDRAPRYLLFDLRAADNRLAAQDDSLAQLQILNRYEAVGVEAGNILLRRREANKTISRNEISQHDYKIEEWLNVPQLDNPVWTKVRLKEHLLSHLAAFAYKPSQYAIELAFKNGSMKTYKFIPQMAATGFLINPLILDNNDVLTVRSRQEYLRYQSDSHPALSKVVKFRIVCNKQAALCGKGAVVAFDEIQGLALGEDVDAGKFNRFKGHVHSFDLGIADNQAVNSEKKGGAFGTIFYETWVVVGRNMLHKPRGFQKLKAFYGFHPSAYQQGIAMGSLVLYVRFVTLSGEESLMYKRKLNPLEIATDRGEHLLELDLPSEEGTLFIEPNLNKDSALAGLLHIRNLVLQKSNR